MLGSSESTSQKKLGLRSKRSTCPSKKNSCQKKLLVSWLPDGTCTTNADTSLHSYKGRKNASYMLITDIVEVE